MKEDKSKRMSRKDRRALYRKGWNKYWGFGGVDEPVFLVINCPKLDKASYERLVKHVKSTGLFFDSYRDVDKAGKVTAYIRMAYGSPEDAQVDKVGLALQLRINGYDVTTD